MPIWFAFVRPKSRNYLLTYLLSVFEQLPFEKVSSIAFNRIETILHIVLKIQSFNAIALVCTISMRKQNKKKKERRKNIEQPQ